MKAGQNTLYKMRWNPANPGTHQYATDINWANVNAQVLKQFYDKIGESVSTSKFQHTNKYEVRQLIVHESRAAYFLMIIYPVTASNMTYAKY